MDFGSNTIEFRTARKVTPSGAVVDERMQYRVKDTVISVLGVNLGVWSDWHDFGTDLEVVNVDEQGRPL